MSTRNVARDVLPHKEKLTLIIPHAAAYTDSSPSTFRRRFVDSGLVKLIDLGGRTAHVLRSDVDAAILKIAAEQKADPSLIVPRNGGAVLKARGIVGNKYGRHGKPAEVARAERKAQAARK